MPEEGKTMTMRDDYTNQMATNLKQWSTQLGELQTKVQHAGAEQKAQLEANLTALKAQQTAYQEQMKKARDASDAAFADIRQGSERMAAEFAKSYAQAFGRFAA
jgi:septal ring factor EnvC (AmiA/AmiB activator)